MKRTHVYTYTYVRARAHTHTHTHTHLVLIRLFHIQEELAQGLVLGNIPRGVAGHHQIERDAAIEYVGHVVFRDAERPPPEVARQLMPTHHRVQLTGAICE